MTFDDIKKLRQKKYREELGYYLAEGEHLVLELGKALETRPELKHSKILISHEYAAQGLPAGFPTQLAIETLNARQMNQLSETRAPQGIIAVVPILPAPAPSQSEKCIYLHEIQDPGNLGTILRTLAWFGGFRCLLSPSSVDPYNSKVVRASMGAVFSVPVETDISVETMTNRFSRWAVLDANGEPIATQRFKDFDCYVFGNEARGVPTVVVHAAEGSVFTITGCGKMESLNVATAVNLSVYELCR